MYQVDSADLHIFFKKKKQIVSWLSIFELKVFYRWKKKCRGRKPNKFLILCKAKLSK